MNYSEFADVVHRVFDSAAGDSLVQDLALPQLQSRTAKDALDDGVEPQEVWNAIVAEMELPESYQYLHRVHPNDTHA